MTIAIAIDKDKMTIDQALKALGYTPDAAKWDAKDDKAKWQEITKKKNEREVTAAKQAIREFVSGDHKLPAPVLEAINRIVRPAKIGGGGSHANPFMDAMRNLFPKPKTAVSEIDVFVATKMGRGEMRAKIRQNLKSAKPADRMWIEFNADTESWVLLAKGEKQPKGWAGKAIDAATK